MTETPEICRCQHANAPGTTIPNAHLDCNPAANSHSDRHSNRHPLAYRDTLVCGATSITD
ncbi:MAG: hypothetical protein R3E31_08745 [Chloroflexota bacterium]